MNKKIGDLIDTVIKNDVQGLKQVIDYSHSFKLWLNPNCYEDSAKVRPLHFAVLNRSLEYAKLLVSMGADSLATDSDGVFSLDLAKELSNQEMLSLLALTLWANNSSCH